MTEMSGTGSTDGWGRLGAWWREELTGDPAYGSDVQAVLLELKGPSGGERWLDLGCGEGRTMRRMRSTGTSVIGCDINTELLQHARSAGPVVQARLPDLGWLRDHTVDGVYASLVLEHLDDGLDLFAEVHRVVRKSGVFVVVMNHPVITAPESGPIVDPSDREVFWRWGRYLERGSTIEPAGDGTIVFYHRPLAEILNAAARAGWTLEELVERPIVKPELTGQEQIPRLLGVRWRKAL